MNLRLSVPLHHLVLRWLLPLALLCIATAPARADDSLARMNADKVIKVGWISSPPTAYKDLKTGELTGIYIDMLRYIMDQAKVKIEFTETTWSTFAAGLNAKQFDLVAAGTFASIPRATSVAFTKPIFLLGYNAIVLKGDTRFKSPADFDKAGVRISVVLGSGGHEYAKRTFKNAEIVALNTGDLTASIAAVAAKRADLAIEDQSATRRYLAKNPEVEALFPEKPFNFQAIAWPVRTGDIEFEQFIDTSIQWLQLSGTLDQIIAKYPGADVYRPLYK